MKCPVCNTEIEKNYCIRCGYIKDSYAKIPDNLTNKKSDLEIYLGGDFNEIIYNKTNLIIFILGPLYFCYRKSFLLGFVLGIIDIIVTSTMGIVFESLLVLLITIVLNRIIYTSFANALYLKICSYRLNKLKTQHSQDYNYILNNYKSKNIWLPILAIIIFLFIIILWVFAYRIYRGNLY